MKNCKKITALVIALVLSLSVCIGAGAAQAEADTDTTVITTTPSNASAEDLTYVAPTFETTTEKNFYDSLDDSIKEPINNIGENIRSEIPVLEQLLEKIRGFLSMLIDFFKELSNVAFN